MVRKEKVLFVVLIFLTAACANGPCRQLREPQLAAQQSPATAAVEAPAGTALAKAGNVFVYKADGSLQCEKKLGITPQEMEKELKGIPVSSRTNRPDGMMHIQSCGSPSGRVNVYEIPATSLKEAEKRGFKKLET